MEGDGLALRYTVLVVSASVARADVVGSLAAGAHGYVNM